MGAYTETMRMPEPPIDPPEPRHDDETPLPRCHKCGNLPDAKHPALIEWESKMYCEPHWIDAVTEHITKYPIQAAGEMGLTVATYCKGED